MFGPTINEIWTQLAAEIGAEFKKPGAFSPHRMRYSVGQWEVVLKVDTEQNSSGIIMKAPFINKDGFQFKIFKSHVFADLGKGFGMQDVIVGDPEFDRNYVIQGNSVKKLKELFADEKLKQLIRHQSKMNFYVADNEGMFGPKFPPGVDMICFRATGMKKDPEALKALFALFIYTLKKLVDMDSASQGNPMIKLK